MAKTDFTSVDVYIASRPEADRVTLERVRAVIRKAIPQATEVISYQIPAYRVAGGTAVYFAGWKDHYSLYPVSDGVRVKLAKELEGYDVNDKGTIRFPLKAKIPERLIAAIAKLLVEEAVARASAKTAAAAKKKAAAKKVAARRPAAKKKRSAGA